MDAPHLLTPPSAWVMRFAEQVTAGGTVLDVACGAGRHARFFAARGHPVDAIDRDASAFADPPPLVRFICADLESAPPATAWPLPGKRYAAVVVTHYLHRPLLPTVVDAVAPGGLLIYETFAVGNEQHGRPSRADFLLQPGELLEAVRGQLQVIAYEHGYVDTPKPAVMQRIAARRLNEPATT